MTKRRISMVLLSTLGMLVLPAAIVGVILWASRFMRETTHTFLGHVRSRRDADAYAMTTRALRAQVPLAAFSAYLDENAPNVRQSESEWINGFSGGGSTECMDVWVSGHGLSNDTIYVLLEEEDGVWRIDRITRVEIDECDSD